MMSYAVRIFLLTLVAVVSISACASMPRTAPPQEIEDPLPGIEWAEASAYCQCRDSPYEPRTKRVAADGRVWFEGFGAWDGPAPPPDSTIDRAEARQFIEEAKAAYRSLEPVQCAVDHDDYFALELVDDEGVARRLSGCGSKYRRRVEPLLR